ncbi:unnamed protein product [Lymnaea stagnalis]|uniref:Uncharacterized protein n=1 Tax=Lymnaea stagnalis TaxID=6523 RepID=A0AAV2HWU2_LYMST
MGNKQGRHMLKWRNNEKRCNQRESIPSQQPVQADIYLDKTGTPDPADDPGVQGVDISSSSGDDHQNDTRDKDVVTAPPDYFYVFDCKAIDHGDHEVEESDEAGSDLHSRKAACSKNPGHTHFIPVASFTIDHLPEDYRQDAIFQLIQLQARLTVKISTRCVSPDRPEFYPDSDAPYPFYNRCGDKFTRNGTGMIWEVQKYTPEANIPCPCAQCLNSPDPITSYGYVRIQTAAHVVFDEIEARESACFFGYDSEDGNPVVIDCLSHFDLDIANDESFLSCYVHDEDLVNALVDAMTGYEQLCGIVSEVYWPYRLHARLTVIASHPHGCSKQISLGEWTRMNRMYGSDNVTTYNYTTCTCPGSSGAYVYLLGKPRRGFHHAHKGTNSYGNCSGIGID